MSQLETLNLEINQLLNLYNDNSITPVDVVNEVYRRISAQGDSSVWVSLVPKEEAISNAQTLITKRSTTNIALPLYGIPFCVKDNIHVSHLKTTASCPKFGFYPKETATVVEKLLAAGAILIGKNTMDQFATGLVGIRSDGHPVNPFNSEYIPGGSSSGSAVAVSTGLVSFSLGSDTGGSGRIPAALNNIVGLKPTPGLISTHGMVYANRSFDCVPIFALSCNDAQLVFDTVVGFDAKDPFAIRQPNLFKNIINDTKKLTIGIPDKKHRQFFGDALSEAAFDDAITNIQSLGVNTIEIDFSLFLEAGKMIFDGPFLAERYASLGEFFKSNRSDVNEVVGGIIDKAQTYSAIDLCNEYYKLKEIQQKASEIFNQIDVMMVPTAGTIYKIADVEKDPVKLNANMGYYTYYANILKLSALAIPAAIRSDGLPFGVCFLAEAEKDYTLMELGSHWEELTKLPLGALNIA